MRLATVKRYGRTVLVIDRTDRFGNVLTVVTRVTEGPRNGDLPNSVFHRVLKEPLSPVLTVAELEKESDVGNHVLSLEL